MIVHQAQAQRQQVVPFENIQVRYQSAFNESKPNAFLINTPAELEKVLTDLKLTANPGSIDLAEFLAEQSLLLVYGGNRPTSGHKLHVLKVTRSRKELIIKSRLFVPGTNCYVPQVVTYPLQVVAIPKTQGVRLTLDLLQSTQDCK
ncbi:MAG: hypothetical protein C0424_09325 [Sphingobacteriaceae bacterium]|nr:hypothetical protein [Sphingobacteriaceae bacterium]